MKPMNVLPDSCPARLYKYRCFDQDGNGLRMLCDNEIYFASPEHLNDPHDCTNAIRYDLMTQTQVYHHMLRMFDLSRHNSTVTERKRRAREAAKDIKHPRLSGKSYEEFIQEQSDEIGREWGVFSMSAESHNDKMWSLYSDGHQGFVVEFDSIRLRDFVKESYSSVLPLVMWQVTYHSVLPTINPAKMHEEDVPRMILSTKLDTWREEEEYRLLFFKHTNEAIHLPQNIITSVIMGQRISSEHKSKITQILQTRGDKLPLYRMTTDPLSADRKMRREVVAYG